jgi:hypothetical protein
MSIPETDRTGEMAQAMIPVQPDRASDTDAGAWSWSWSAITPAELATRIRTGCVYERQPTGTFGVLVTRSDPRTRRRAYRTLAPIHAHWSTFAPSVALLTGHPTACRSRRCHGAGRCVEHARVHLGGPAFAQAYRAELERCSLHTRLAVARQVIEWLRIAPTLTILSFERRAPHGPTLLVEEEVDGVTAGWAQRHVFRDWLVSLLASVGPLSAAHLRTERGWLLQRGLLAPVG